MSIDWGTFAWGMVAGYVLCLVNIALSHILKRQEGEEDL